MRVRRYADSDYSSIQALLSRSAQGDCLPAQLGGLGIVIELDGNLIGFVWALVSEDSSHAYVEYFAVDPDRRGNRIIGPLLMKSLIGELASMGKTKVIGVLKHGADYTETLCRIYKDVGMDVSDARIVCGDPANILSNINKRYGQKEPSV